MILRNSSLMMPPHAVGAGSKPAIVVLDFIRAVLNPPPDWFGTRSQTGFELAPTLVKKLRLVPLEKLQTRLDAMDNGPGGNGGPGELVEIAAVLFHPPTFAGGVA